MLRRFCALFALLGLVHAQLAVAANQKPPDVPVPVLQSITYASGTTKNKLGPTGTATVPDTPAWYASMPADIPTTSRTNWITTGSVGSNNFEDCSNLTISCEAKFRSFLGESHVLYDDPIRNYGEPGTSHAHQFFGNMSTNAFSTYASLRTRNEARSGGGRLNATAYWSPAVLLTNPFSDGKNYAAKIGAVGLYYLADNSVSEWLVSLPTGLRYVGGTNMDDPEDTKRKRAVVVANAQTSTSGRYGYRGNGYEGIECLSDTNGDGVLETLTGSQTANGGPWQPYLNSTTGQNVSDPFLGNCKTNTTSGANAVILFDFNGPDCWDGVNPWVPGGYDHVIMSVTDTQLNAARVQRACPNGWYHLPSITLKVQYTTTGWADYQRWRLASDNAMQAALNALPACTTDATGAYANAPCATRSGPLWNGSTYAVPNGASFHTDWMMGWDGLTLKTWEANCLGVRNLYNGNGNINTTTGTLISSTPHTCASSVIASTEGMKMGVPPDSSHNPIVSQSVINYPTSSASNMWRVRTVNPSGLHDFNVH